MSTSAHAYVRGSTARFYEWLDSSDGRKLPAGPLIWICGDAHVGNLGPIARSDGVVEVELRDLDQTVVGNPAHDLVRLALSLAMTARSADLPGVTTALLTEELMQGYLDAFSAKRRKTESESAAVQLVLRQALKRKWKHFLREHIGLDSRLPIGARFWPLTAAEREEVEAFLDKERIRTLVTQLATRSDDAEIRVVDAAFWVKGCSSLGLWRCAALVRVKSDGSRGKKNPGYSLLDLKQAVTPLAPRSANATLPAHQGERVVSGALGLSPALGERMVWGTVTNREVFVRELLPQDLKLELERLDAMEVRAVSRTLGRILGLAHARQMDSAHRTSWKKELQRGISRSLDAPSWLWWSVVELVGAHESAYLHHCRRYALETAHATSKTG